jgi:hypothetical protein
MYQTAANSDKRRILDVLTGKKPDHVPNFEVLVDDPALTYIMGREIRGAHTLDNIPAAPQSILPDFVGKRPPTD